jgi:hypothetical protein
VLFSSWLVLGSMNTQIEQTIVEFRRFRIYIQVVTCNTFISLSTFHKTLSTKPSPSRSSTVRIASQTSLSYGACTPGVFNTPSSTSCVVIPHGKPTVNAIAECPSGSGLPYFSNVDVSISYKKIVFLVSRRGKKKAIETHFFTVLPLNDKLVLQHDEVPFSRLVFHQRLELRAERVEKVPASWFDLVIGEQANPS